MGFPTWTLIGMGVSILLALIAVGLSLLGQSPGTIRRLNLDNSRLVGRVRAYTGWGFALLLMTIGFFLAGVPLGSIPEPTASLPEATQVAGTTPEATPLAAATTAVETDLEPTVRNTVSTGAFGQPAATEAGPTPTSPIAEDSPTPEAETDEQESAEGDETATPSQTAVPTSTPTETLVPTATLTPTPSSTPTQTPSPTLTPTPIDGDTAEIVTNGSTLWVRRTPGGAPLVIVRDGDVVLLMSGHANQGGIEWREVRTVDGFLGWVQTEFLIEA